MYGCPSAEYAFSRSELSKSSGPGGGEPEGLGVRNIALVRLQYEVRFKFVRVTEKPEALGTPLLAGGSPSLSRELESSW